jgi:hypothetical protein
MGRHCRIIHRSSRIILRNRQYPRLGLRAPCRMRPPRHTLIPHFALQ